jgi:hypothetical protein
LTEMPWRDAPPSFSIIRDRRIITVVSKSHVRILQRRQIVLPRRRYLRDEVSQWREVKAQFKFLLGILVRVVVKKTNYSVRCHLNLDVEPLYVPFDLNAATVRWNDRWFQGIVLYNSMQKFNGSIYDMRFDGFRSI